jgi:hypothetical protein
MGVSNTVSIYFILQAFATDPPPTRINPRNLVKLALGDQCGVEFSVNSGIYGVSRS